MYMAGAKISYSFPHQASPGKQAQYSIITVLKISSYIEWEMRLENLDNMYLSIYKI